MESAYGLAITVTMLMTTLLITTYLAKLKKLPGLAVVVLVVFGAIEAVFFISSLGKFAHGGYVTVILTLLLLAIMIIWYRGTWIEHKYSTRLPFEKYIPNLKGLHNDESEPLLANNLVFLEAPNKDGNMDRDILYSILDKDLKRADAYWFLSVNVLSEPDAANYEVETYGTDFIFRVRLNLGFKCGQRVNVYLRQIVKQLQDDGSLPVQKKKFSIYGPSTVGTFKFCIIRKSVTAKTELSTLDEIIIRTKYAIRRLAGSRARWYGLDNSSVILEQVPLITTTGGSVKMIQRKQ
ncbi:MAG: KUP/HAK/KT family potassium transporter, partial [Oscillospiraceae bacterium]|nr:KUP/HAK/KT family potassium transporter [Oscillospiraceae bacterium]